ncbi:glycosyltransferase [Candidatus Kaiserbacteria bacterium]|nr:glycosyltransferase [Candidatus Kaiserbacteria bacterium]
MQKTGQAGNTTEVQNTENKAPHSHQYSGLSLLVIGTETGVFRPETEAAKRIFAYGTHFKEVHIVVVSGPHEYRGTSVGNVHLYPATGSRFSRIMRALSIIRTIPHYDIVTAQDPFENGFVAWHAARRGNVPLHLQIHTDFLSPAFARHSFMNRIRVILAQFLLRRADRIRVVSSCIRVNMMRLNLIAPVAVLPIFVDVDRFRNVADQNLAVRFAQFRTKLLLVSRLEPEKNPCLALKSFANAAPQSSCLIILGKGSEQTHLIQLAKELNISDRVFFEGEKDAAPYYAISDIVLITSRYEGYGRVFIEASAARKPVLSTDVGIARESGATVASEKDFARALAEWFTSGPRTNSLKSYPYHSFDEYVRAYCDDIARSCE